MDRLSTALLEEARDLLAHVSTFTTGTGMDFEAPSFAGVTALAYGETSGHFSGVCSSRDVVEVEPSFEPATDDRAVTAGIDRDGVEAPALRYNVYIDGILAVPFYTDLQDDRWGQIVVDCAEHELQVGSVVTKAANLEVRAVDLAGNESEPNGPLSVDVACTFAEPAARPASTSDDGTPGTRSISRGPGCSLARAHGSASLLSLLALLLPVSLIRGRRRPLK